RRGAGGHAARVEQGPDAGGEVVDFRLDRAGVPRRAGRKLRLGLEHATLEGVVELDAGLGEAGRGRRGAGLLGLRGTTDDALVQIDGALDLRAGRLAVRRWHLRLSQPAPLERYPQDETDQTDPHDEPSLSPV